MKSLARSSVRVAGATLVSAALALCCSSAAFASCASVAACVFGANTGSGYGVEGTAAKNSGVFGSTALNSTSASHAAAGVYGADLSTNKGAFDAGVAGVSKTGDGVRGTSTTGHGLLGVSSAGAGVAGTSKTGVAVSGSSSGGDGVDGVTGSPGHNGVYGYDNEAHGGGIGVYGNSLTGTGVYGLSHNSISAGGVTGESRIGNGVQGIADSSEFFPGAGIEGVAGDPGNYVFVGMAGGDENPVTSIDYGGNMILSGTLTQNGSPLLRTRASDGATYVSYGARATMPQFEDVGEARLVNGGATIAIDRAFGSTIDRSTPYLVFLTPLGDTHGLYVSRRGPSGFDVRETEGGRGNIVFDYRIVAKPLDTNGTRLAAASTLPAMPRTFRKRAAP